MTKTYKLSKVEVENEQKTITISEDVTETREEKTTVAQLKEEHARLISQIEDMGARADGIVDKLKGIERNLTDITVTGKPERVIDAKATKMVMKGKGQ